MSLILKPGTLVVIQLGPHASDYGYGTVTTGGEAFSLLDNTIAMVIRHLEKRVVNYLGPPKGTEMYALLCKNEVVTFFRDEFKLLE